MQLPDFREARRADMPALAAIERDAFGNEAMDEDTLTAYVRHRRCIAMALVIPGMLIGAAYYAYNQDHDLLAIHRIAVLSALRRQGHGRRMVDDISKQLDRFRCSSLEVVVEERNLPAQCFFRGCGFNLTNTYRGWFPDGQDGYVLTRAAAKCDEGEHGK